MLARYESELFQMDLNLSDVFLNKLRLAVVLLRKTQGT